MSAQSEGPTYERPATPSTRTSVAEALDPEPPELPATTVDESRPSVRVRFIDEHGAPIAGVELCSSSDRSRKSLSGLDGKASFVLAPEQEATPRLSLEARCPGYAASERSALVTPGESLLLDDWALVSGGSVEGRVVGPDGLGLEGVRVACLGIPYSAEDWERDRRGGFETLRRPGARTTTSPDGGFRLDEVPCGNIRLVAVAGDRPASVSEPVVVPPGGLALAVRIEMAEADGGTGISGIVRDPQGLPVPQASIEVSSSGSRSQYILVADSQGRFGLLIGSKESCDLIARDPAGRYRPAVLEGVPPGGRDLELNLLPAPEVELYVHSDGSEPIERFSVALTPAGGRGRAPNLGSFTQAHRPDGVLLFGAPAEDFFVEVRANGWEPARLGPFSASAPPSRLDCPLRPAAGLRGTVTAGGLPIEGAILTLHPAVTKNDVYNGFPLRMSWRPKGITTSDGNGEFVLSIEEEGSYFVLADAEGYALAEIGPLTLAPSRDQQERIELDPGGTLAVRVRAEDPRTVAGMLVAMSRGDGLAFTTRADEAGEVWVDGLTPGPWQVELATNEIEPGYGATQYGSKKPAPIPSNCRVFSGEVTRVDLWLDDETEGACRLAGNLTLDGKPAEGWLASLDLQGSRGSEEQAFPEAGSFSLMAQEPGPYRLRLLADTQDPAAMLVILDDVELFEGTRYWSLELETGVLAGALAGDSSGSMVFYRWRRGDLQVFAPLVPDPAGRFRCERAPAGRGQLVRADPNQPLEAQEMSVLRELEVVAGQMNEVGP